jgi:hypothetical protein
MGAASQIAHHRLYITNCTASSLQLAGRGGARDTARLAETDIAADGVEGCLQKNIRDRVGREEVGTD